VFDLKILYAEDEEDIRTLLARVLKKLAKEVIVAQNGLEALSMYKECSPDIIITDINMPKMSGFEMAEKVRENNKLIPIIAVTAHNDTEHFMDAIKLGVTSFLVKPVEISELQRVLTSVEQIVNLQRDNRQKSALLEQYKSAVDSSNLVSKTDINGVITYVNDHFCKVSGYTVEELIGKPHNIVRHPDTPKSLFEELWSTITQKKMWRGKIKNLAKNGETYVVDTTILPIVDENGEIEEFISIRTDITALENALMQAKIAEKAKGDFLAAMSHEIRTPLNAILGFTSLLKEVQSKALMDEYLSIIESSGKNLLSIINDILDYSKLESGSFDIEKCEFEPLGEFEPVVDLFAVKAYEKKILLLSFIDPRLPKKLIGDPLRLRQILSNLLSNAIKFTPDGKEIEINITASSVNGDKIKVLFEVKDSGVGIPQDKLEKIFTPFSQADAGISRKYGGTGLGLSISSSLASMMGGRLLVESKEGVGSRFWFEIDFEIADAKPSYVCENAVKAHVDSCLNQRTALLLTRYLEAAGFVLSDTAFDADFAFVCKSADNMTGKPIEILVSDSPFFAGEENGFRVVRLPLCATKIKKAINQEPTTKAETIKEPKKEFKQKVLVADDNGVNLKLISVLLAKYKIEAVLAKDGEEAVSLFERGDYPLVFLDIHMPKMDGIEAMKAIKERGAQDSKIVALTANANLGDKERFLEAGFDAYLQKPIDEKELLSVLEAYLDGKTSDYVKLLEERLGLDKESIAMLLEEFVQNSVSEIVDMNTAVENGDLEKLFELAHKIKGAAANLRLENIRTIAMQIEQNALKEVKECDYYSLIESLDKEIASINYKEI
jgi:PAS domain S-box-containing protein